MSLSRLKSQICDERSGVGRLIFNAVSARDIPVALGGIFVVGAVFVLANLVADVATAMLDPRRRAEM